MTAAIASGDPWTLVTFLSRGGQAGFICGLLFASNSSLAHSASLLHVLTADPAIVSSCVKYRFHCRI